MSEFPFPKIHILESNPQREWSIGDDKHIKLEFLGGGHLGRGKGNPEPMELYCKIKNKIEGEKRVGVV